AGDRRRGELAGAVVQQLLDDDGAPVARSARASRRVAALAGLVGHVWSPMVVVLVLVGVCVNDERRAGAMLRRVATSGARLIAGRGRCLRSLSPFRGVHALRKATKKAAEKKYSRSTMENSRQLQC